MGTFVMPNMAVVAVGAKLLPLRSDVAALFLDMI